MCSEDTLINTCDYLYDTQAYILYVMYLMIRLRSSLIKVKEVQIKHILALLHLIFIEL